MSEPKWGLLDELADFAERHPQARSAYLCRDAKAEIERLRAELEVMTENADQHLADIDLLQAEIACMRVLRQRLRLALDRIYGFSVTNPQSLTGAYTGESIADIAREALGEPKP